MLGVLMDQSFTCRLRGAALLALVVAAAYMRLALSGLDADWLALDDVPELYHVRGAANLSQLPVRDVFGFFRPLKNLLFLAFDRLSRHGMAPVRLFAATVVALSAAGVYWLMFTIFRNSLWSWLALAFWLLSPTSVCAYKWLSAVNIAAMTGTAAAAAAMREKALEPGGRRRLLWTSGFLLLLLISLGWYEGAVAIPPVLIALDFFLHPERLRIRAATGRRALLLHAGGVLIVAGYLLVYVKVWGLGLIKGGNFWGASRAEVMFAAAYFYFQHLWTWLWPFGRMALVGAYISGMVPAAVLWFCWLGLALMAVGVVLARRRFPVAALGLAWFLICFAPTSNILGSRSGPYGSYYLILPGVGLALCVAAIIRRLLEGGAIGRVRVLAAGFLLFWRIATVAEAVSWSEAWSNPEQIWQRTLRTFPHAFGAMVELAKLRIAAGDYAGAEHLLQQAERVAPGWEGHLALMAMIADRAGRPDQGLKYVEKLLRKYPGHPWALRFKGYLYEDRLGRPEEAEKYYRAALKRSPWNVDSVDAAQALAYWLAARGRREEAIELWETCLRYSPDDPVIHYNLAVAYHEVGKEEEAVRHAKVAQQAGLNPPVPGVTR